MSARKQVNLRKDTLFTRISVGLLVCAFFHGAVRGLWIDGTLLDADKFNFFVVVPVSAVVSGLCISIVLRHPGFVAARNGMPMGNWVVVFAFLLLGPFSVYASADVYNMVLDGADAAQHTLVEMGQYLSKGRGSSYTYFVTVRDEDDPQKREADIRVSEAFYAMLRPGEKLHAMYHKGAFGFPWLSGLTVIPRAETLPGPNTSK